MSVARLFDTYIGIDYSGAGSPNTRLREIQVYLASSAGDAQPVPPPDGKVNWSREFLARELLSHLQRSERVIAGIDHAFSFPAPYLSHHHLTSWDAFLQHFCSRWPTDQLRVQEVMNQQTVTWMSLDLRLTERWTPSARSVFQFGVNGEVATSTHAGIPWLRWLRTQVEDRVHFWPFDGFDVPSGKSVVGEVYPTLFRSRYRDSGLTSHKLDAFAVCRWLQERDGLGFLERYFHPLLSPPEQETALLEGWILGLM